GEESGDHGGRGAGGPRADGADPRRACGGDGRQRARPARMGRRLREARPWNGAEPGLCGGAPGAAREIERFRAARVCLGERVDAGTASEQRRAHRRPRAAAARPLCGVPHVHGARTVPPGARAPAPPAVRAAGLPLARARAALAAPGRVGSRGGVRHERPQRARRRHRRRARRALSRVVRARARAPGRHRRRRIGRAGVLGRAPGTPAPGQGRRLSDRDRLRDGVHAFARAGVPDRLRCALPRGPHRLDGPAGPVGGLRRRRGARAVPGRGEATSTRGALLL
ncbi:MAG: hypothetical protein AVDCRST_MAG89-1520, partial [uncultured Gemmatimonadetes bacterium]